MMAASFLAALAALPGPAVRAGLRPVHFAPAQGPLLERVLAETGVARFPSKPSPLSYSEAWSEAVARWLERFFGDRPGVFEGLGRAMVYAALLAVAAALGFLVVLLLRSLRAHRRPSSRAGQAATSAVPAAAPVRDAEGWKREIEHRLRSGDVAGALEALWWWLARSLAGERADASWTTRELVVYAGRRDLLALVPYLDVLMYAPRRPAAADVAACRERLERMMG